MTLKESFNGLITDLRELKAAAQAHNVASYEPPASVQGPQKPADDTSGPGSTSTTLDKPSPPLTTTEIETPTAPKTPATQSEPAAAQEVFIPPPPPPKNLPHGWTARYDKKECKFSYSQGVGSKEEQWDFRKELLHLPHASVRR